MAQFSRSHAAFNIKSNVDYTGFISIVESIISLQNQEVTINFALEKVSDQSTVSKWLSVPIIATITRLLSRELTFQNEYLRQENKLLKSKINKRIVFTDNERRILVEAAMAMGKRTYRNFRLSYLHVFWMRSSVTFSR